MSDAAAECGLPLGVETRFGNGAGRGDVGEHIEMIAGSRGDVETSQVYRRTGTGLLDPLVSLKRVVHRLDPTVSLAADHYVAHSQSAVLHDYFGDDASTRFLLGFQAGT